MNKSLVILEEDKQWARDRIAALDAEIQSLGPEFYEVFNQSSETWHDNAPFDALRDRQSLLDAERQKLRAVLRESVPGVPKPKKGVIGIGSIVEIEQKERTRRYLIAGDWTPNPGEVRDGSTVVSVKSPLGESVLGKKAGSTTAFGTIVSV